MRNRWLLWAWLAICGLMVLAAYVVRPQPAAGRRPRGRLAVRRRLRARLRRRRDRGAARRDHPEHRLDPRRAGRARAQVGDARRCVRCRARRLRALLDRPRLPAAGPAASRRRAEEPEGRRPRRTCSAPRRPSCSCSAATCRACGSWSTPASGSPATPTATSCVGRRSVACCGRSTSARSPTWSAPSSSARRWPRSSCRRSRPRSSCRDVVFILVRRYRRDRRSGSVDQDAALS